MRAMSPWTGWENAEVYDAFTRSRDIYKRLNEKLVELADIRSAKRVLDLACGAGATTLACLPSLDRDAEIVGVDASDAMVAVARAGVLDPRARFEVAPAASIHEVLVGSFDRVVCNAAFWQFPSPFAALSSLARVTETGTRFVFNVPAERVEGESSEIHPFQMALARGIEARTGTPMSRMPITIDPALLDGWLSESDFALKERVRFVYEGPQEELIELMEIPAMIEPITPGLEREDREAVIDEARGKVSGREIVRVPWIYFVVVRR